MRRIVQDLFGVSTVYPTTDGVKAQVFDLWTLGDRDAYLITGASIGLDSGSANPKVTAAGTFRLEVAVATGETDSPNHCFRLKDLVAVGGAAGGAAAGQSLDFPPRRLEIFEPKPTNNVFAHVKVENIDNDPTVAVIIRIEYEVVSLSLSEVARYLTR